MGISIKMSQKSSKGYGDDEIEGLFTLPSLGKGGEQHAMSPSPVIISNLIFIKCQLLTFYPMLGRFIRHPPFKHVTSPGRD